MKNAIYVKCAKCHGQGSDPYKWVSGLTKSIISKCNEIDPTATILVTSHTLYQGNIYKRAEYQGKYGWKHRQINDRDYNIIGIISIDGTVNVLKKWMNKE